MTNLLQRIMYYLFGRRMMFRIGRAMYMKARGDFHNDIMSNGEMLVQNCVINAWKRNNLYGNRLVVFDVGANVGDWSSVFLKLLGNSNMRQDVELFVFEPVPSTFESLRNRLGIQDPYLHLEQVALSSVNGKGIIYVSDTKSGTNSLHKGSQGGNEESIAIVKETATDYCENHKVKKVHLFKCDTEGHDMEVIRGALPLLVNERVSVLQFEYNHRWIYARNYLKDVFVAVENLPYKVGKLQPDHILIFSEWHPELEKFFEGNYALIHMDALNWFPLKLVTWSRYNSMDVGTH